MMFNKVLVSVKKNKRLNDDRLIRVRVTHAEAHAVSWQPHEFRSDLS